MIRDRIRKYFIRTSDTVENKIFTNTCRISRRRRKYNPSGTSDYIEYPLSYKGSSDIPCLIHASRYFRQPILMEQEILVADYNLHLPVSIEVRQGDRIFINDNEYQIRKFTTEGDFRFSQELIVSRVTQGGKN